VGRAAKEQRREVDVDFCIYGVWEDPIVKETRAAREELFARFNYDLAALCDYLRKKQGEHSERVVTREPRRPESVDTLNK